MKVQLTNYGVSLINETQEPIAITKYVLGSSYDYTPTLDQAGIIGDQVYEGTTSDPIIVNANVVKYEAAIDYRIGPFVFGEIAYFDSTNTCVAVAVSDEQIAKKIQTNKDIGNSIRIDTYLSMVGTNYDMWADFIGSDIEFNVPTVASVDALPATNSNDPNMYVVAPVSSSASSVLAYTSTQTGSDLWHFDCYTFNNVREKTVKRATATSLVIDIKDLDDEARQDLYPRYYGDKIIEFSSGKLFSICRYVATVVIIGDEATYSFKTALAEIPEEGDLFLLFSRTDVSISDLQIPIASETTLGGIIIGDGLSVEPNGVTSVDFPVTSVNGQVGDVVISSDDVEGFAKVAYTGSYNDLLNKPKAYTLPIASSTVLGGVMIGDNLSISPEGVLTISFSPVTSVNNIYPVNGNVTIDIPTVPPGLTNPTALAQNTDLNSVTTVGLYYATQAVCDTITNKPTQVTNTPFTLEVVPTTGTRVVQRIMVGSTIYSRMNFPAWTAWTYAYTPATGLPVASTTQSGTVIVGSGLTITNGILSASGGSSIGDLTWEAIDAVNHYNMPEGIPKLTSGDAESSTASRIEARQSAYGTLLYLGDWDPNTNTLSNCVDASKNGLGLADTGLFSDATSGFGYFIRVSADGTSSVPTNTSEAYWKDDIIVGVKNQWLHIMPATGSMTEPEQDTPGFLTWNPTASDPLYRVTVVTFSSPDGSITIANPNGEGNTQFSVRPATVSAIGGVIVGDNLTVTSNGTISVNSTYTGDFTVTGAFRAASLNATSDARLKTEITHHKDIDLSSIRAYRYRLTTTGEPSKEYHVGLLAQEVQSIVPEAVTEDKETGYLSLDYNAIVAVLLEKINKLESQVKTLLKDREIL